ncbi:MAG: DUF6036 family nucleotidyltransferase [Ktedonobacteraceae bacterium]
MNKRDIEKYLRMVGQELEKEGLTFEILLLGGAAMLIEVENRDSTQDVDTYFLPDFLAITKAAAIVAGREGLPDGWLNAAADGFTYSFMRQPERKLWKKFPGLHVYTASLDYLFVTKMMAGRPKDDTDIVALARMMHISTQEEALALMVQYVPKEQITVDVLRGISRCFKL